MAHTSIIMLVCHRITSVRVLQKKSKKWFDSGLILILESIIPLLPIIDTGIFNYPVSCFCWPWLKLCYFHTFVGQRKLKSTHFRNHKNDLKLQIDRGQIIYATLQQILMNKDREKNRRPIGILYWFVGLKFILRWVIAIHSTANL